MFCISYTPSTMTADDLSKQRNVQGFKDSRIWKSLFGDKVKRYLQWHIECHRMLWCWFWHQCAIESHWNCASDWHGRHGLIYWQLLDMALLDSGKMLLYQTWPGAMEIDVISHHKPMQSCYQKGYHISKAVNVMPTCVTRAPTGLHQPRYWLN